MPIPSSWSTTHPHSRDFSPTHSWSASRNTSSRTGSVEIASSAAFIGYVGLWSATFDAHFTPAVEIGWRLRSDVWGHGYATEAARLALADVFGRIGLDEIVSFTAAINQPSRRVMEKLGMQREPADDFDHPSVTAQSPLRPHVLYRFAARDWALDNHEMTNRPD